MRRIRNLSVAVIAALLVTSSAQAGQVKLSVAMSNPVLKAEQKQTTFLKVGLTGFKMPTVKERAPVNIALVLDKSGSMSGEKITEARKAAIEAVRRLNRNDIVSVITYDSTVQVLVPATKLTNKEAVCARIAEIEAGGRTALFAGVSKGAAELRKFIHKERVNRIVLLSDGKANVGPSSPSELGDLGHSLKKERISVSTMGLGLDYNEDLMAQIASRSGGNHIFIEDASELAGIFQKEFNDVLSVVAQEIAVRINLEKNMRPVRVLGNEAEINGQKVITELAQLYSDQEKFVVLEVEIPASPANKPKKVASVAVEYDNLLTKATDELSGTASVNFSDDPEVVRRSQNVRVLETSVLLLANERNKLATILCDKGDLAGAKKALTDNVYFLERYAKELDSTQLRLFMNINTSQVQGLTPENLQRLRKSMRREQFKVDNAQRY